jgi:hypothetical protein
MHESILVFRNMRYLKVALALLAVSGIAYILHKPLGPPNGGTWLGYTLGTVAALLMIWLAWFGIKKRRYGIGKASTQEWLSAHVYLGTALILVATLHTGFHFGMNVHTLFYVLMMIVIASGMVGVYFYLRYPLLLTRNRGGLSSELMLAQLADLDREIRQLAMGLDNTTNSLALKAVQETVVGGNLLQQLRGADVNCPTTVARAYVENSSGDSTAEQDTRRRQLLARLVRKEDSLQRIRRDIQLRCLLRLWLYVHIPFSIAALAALLVHVVTEFYYW